MRSETSKAEIWHCSFCGFEKLWLFKSNIANVFICLDCVNECAKPILRPSEPKPTNKKIWDKV